MANCCHGHRQGQHQHHRQLLSFAEQSHQLAMMALTNVVQKGELIFPTLMLFTALANWGLWRAGGEICTQVRWAA